MTTAFLMEMGWKSALVLGAALLIATLLRSRSAADRGDVLRSALALLPLLPLANAYAPPLLIQTPSYAPVLTPVTANFSDGLATYFDINQALPLVYAASAAFLLTRVLVGLGRLQLWVTRASPIADEAWVRAIGLSRCKARVLLSHDIEAPLSCGWLQPVILIDRGTLKRSEHASAIIAHESAHIARADWPVLIAMHVAAALFWFNPLVWLAKHAAEQCAEECADQRALASVEAPLYAQALLDCARGRRVAVAIGISPRQHLSRRMTLVLTQPAFAPASRFSTAMCAEFVLTLFGGVAASHISERATPQLRGPMAQNTFPPTNALVGAPVVQLASLTTPAADRDALRSESAMHVIVEPAAPTAERQPEDVATPPQVATSALAPTDVNSAEVADERLPLRWQENMRRHEQRNERREEARLRRDRARVNSEWLRAQANN